MPAGESTSPSTFAGVASVGVGVSVAGMGVSEVRGGVAVGSGVLVGVAGAAQAQPAAANRAMMRPNINRGCTFPVIQLSPFDGRCYLRDESESSSRHSRAFS